MVAVVRSKEPAILKSERFRWFNGNRLFGYDFFISFTLGPYPRGTQSYASDLARRLREKNFTVFFSEDEASPGEGLNSTLLKALHQSRILVVIANEGALTQSKWVRMEVEEFRKKHPKRPVIPINVENAIVKQGPNVRASEWLGGEDRIWLNECEQAVMDGIATEELVKRLEIAPRFMKSNVLWFWFKTALILILLGLTAYSAWNAIRADLAAKIAVAQRLKAEAQRLAVQSGQFASQPDLGFLLAGQAYRLLPTDAEIAGALFTSLHVVPELVRFNRGHGAAVESLAIIPEHDLIVSGDYDGKVLGTSRQSGAVVLNHRHPSQSEVVCLRPDVGHERLLVVSNISRYWLSLKDFTVQVEQVFNNEGWVVSCDLDPIHQRLILGRHDGQVDLLNTDNDHIETLRTGGGTTYPPALAFSPDGAMVAMSDARGTVSVRDLNTHKDVWSVSLPDGAQVLSLAYDQDGSILAEGDNGGWVRTWNAKTGQPGQARATRTGPVWQVGFTRGYPGGDYLAAAGGSGEINWFEIKSFLPAPPTRVHNGRINALAFGNDGTYASGANDKVVAYFSPFDPSQRERNIGAPIADLTSSADGSKIAVVAGPKGLLGFYSSATLEPLREPFETGATVSTIALNPQGNRVALGSVDGRLLLLQDREPVGSKTWIQAYAGMLQKVIFSPDGAKLYTLGEDHRLIVWLVDIDGVSSPRTLSTEANQSLALNIEGTRLAAGSTRGGIMIIDPESGNVIAQVDRNPYLGMTAIAYHPHLPRLIVGDAYGSLHLFDTDKNQFIGEPRKGQQNKITGIATVSDDDSVYTSSQDGSLRHWDIRSGGEPVGTTMPLAKGPIRALAIDGSGKLLVSGGNDGKLAVRHIDPEHWLLEGCERFGRRFTQEERLRFGLDKDWPEPCPR